MSDLTRAQFAEAVDAALSTAAHLQSEIQKLYFALRDALAEGESPVLTEVVGPARFRRKAKTAIHIRDSYPALFHASDADEYGEDPYDGSEDGELDDEDSPRKEATAVEIAASSPILALRIVLRRKDGGEPEIAYGVLRDWKSSGSAKQAPDGILRIKPYMARRIPLALDAASAAGRIATKARVHGSRKKNDLITCVAGEIRRVPLFAIDGPDAIEELANGMKELWASV